MMKKHLLTFVFGCIIMLLSVNSFSQDTLKVFPKDYVGVYKGNLEIHSSHGVETVGMEFHLEALDEAGNYAYQIVYIQDGNRQERHYNLITINSKTGEYLIDENNGILLNATFIDGSLYSMFEVQGTYLSTSETFYDNAMEFQITVSRASDVSKSETEGDQSIGVLSYPISSVHKARLLKQ